MFVNEKRIPTTRAEIYASNLDAAITEIGMTRKALVAALNDLGYPVSEQAVGKWMRGESAPSPTHQAAIGAVLRIPAHLIFPIILEAAA
jgi:transcriptional regulator with XRE-family HTH domain